MVSARLRASSVCSICQRPGPGVHPEAGLAGPAKVPGEVALSVRGQKQFLGQPQLLGSRADRDAHDLKYPRRLGVVTPP